MANLDLLDGPTPEPQTVPLGDLVVVAEVRDTIHPGLMCTGKVQRGGDEPHHTVVNGENYYQSRCSFGNRIGEGCGSSIQWPLGGGLPVVKAQPSELCDGGSGTTDRFMADMREQPDECRASVAA